MARGSRLVDLVQTRIEDFLAERTSILRSISPDLDPLDEFSRRFLSGGKRFRALFCYWGWEAVAGIGALIAGVALQLLIVGVIGFALMFGGVLLAITPGKRGAAAPAPAEPTSGSSKGKRSGGGFMDRLNDRWDRRQEGRD